MREELEPALKLARTLPLEDLPEFLGDLEVLRCTAFVRLSAPVVSPPPDELLDVDEAAKRLGMSRHFLYRHRKQFPFTRRMGSALRFSANGIENYLRRAR